MKKPMFNPEELRLSEKLAIERTIMGADRTLMASERTALSLISFGFTIYKILQQILKSGAVALVREQTPRNIGIFMILVGVVPLAFSMYQYRQMVTGLGGKTVRVNPNMVSASAILLFGLFLLIVTVWNLDVI